MNETTQPRLCEVCGGPLRRNNTTGICRRTPECNRVRAEKERRARGVGPKKGPQPCGREGCPNFRRRNGYCEMHHARLMKTGDLGGPLPSRGLRTFSAGDTFGRWTALEDCTATGSPVLCRCECGVERPVIADSLLAGRSRSCGCLQRKIAHRPRSTAPYVAAGARYGRLVALEDAWYTHEKIQCRCDCGKTAAKNARSIKTGMTRSCGCLRSETWRTHGLSRHPLYGTWRGMVSRTTNPDDAAYAGYGGRGITVCERWQGMPDGFKNFLADVGERPDGMTLDRIDNDGNYEPGNVRWATPHQQGINRRSVTQLTRERDALLLLVQEQARALGRRRPVAARDLGMDGLF